MVKTISFSGTGCTFGKKMGKDLMLQVPMVEIALTGILDFGEEQALKIWAICIANSVHCVAHYRMMYKSLVHRILIPSQPGPTQVMHF